MVIYTQIRNNYWYRFKPPSYYTSYYLKILWILWLGYVLYDFSFLKILGRFILWQRIWATLVYILWVLKRICYLAVARWIILLISIRFIVEWCYWLTQYPFWFLVFSYSILNPSYKTPVIWETIMYSLKFSFFTFKMGSKIPAFHHS